MKAINTIQSIPKAGVNVQELVMAKYPKQYDGLLLWAFNWNDLDGVLDYLYGVRELMGADADNIIKLIEENCEVTE